MNYLQVSELIDCFEVKWENKKKIKLLNCIFVFYIQNLPIFLCFLKTVNLQINQVLTLN